MMLNGFAHELVKLSAWGAFDKLATKRSLFLLKPYGHAAGRAMLRLGATPGEAVQLSTWLTRQLDDKARIIRPNVGEVLQSGIYGPRVNPITDSTPRIGLPTAIYGEGRLKTIMAPRMHYGNAMPAQITETYDPDLWARNDSNPALDLVQTTFKLPTLDKMLDAPKEFKDVFENLLQARAISYEDLLNDKRLRKSIEDLGLPLPEYKERK